MMNTKCSRTYDWMVRPSVIFPNEPTIIDNKRIIVPCAREVQGIRIGQMKKQHDTPMEVDR